MDPDTVRTHHVRSELCTTRPPYRQGRQLKAVKVYTVAQESCYLLVQGVPSVGAHHDLVKLFALYGEVAEYRLLDSYPAPDFMEVLWFKYKDISSARTAKRKLDDYSFYGGTLHVCYAPEYESVEETRLKLQDRRKAVAGRIRKLALEEKQESAKRAICNQVSQLESVPASKQDDEADVNLEVYAIKEEATTVPVNLPPPPVEKGGAEPPPPPPPEPHFPGHPLQQHTLPPPPRLPPPPLAAPPYSQPPPFHRFPPPLSMLPPLPPPPMPPYDSRIPPPPLVSAVPNARCQYPSQAPDQHLGGDIVQNKESLEALAKPPAPARSFQWETSKSKNLIPSDSGAKHHPKGTIQQNIPAQPVITKGDQVEKLDVRAYKAQVAQKPRFVPRQLLRTPGVKEEKHLKPLDPVNEELKRNAVILRDTSGPKLPAEAAERHATYKISETGDKSLDETLASVRERVRKHAPAAIPVKRLKKS